MTDLQAQAREMLARALDANNQHASAAACRAGNNNDCFVVPRVVALRAIEVALQSRADGPPYAADDWQANGYKSAAEEIDDMANVGRSLMEAIASVITSEGPMNGWAPADDPAEIVTDMANKLVESAEEVERLREALTPSGDTKAAYSGEFRFPVCHHDEDGEEVWHPTIVPWDTIKEIMAAIMARANRTGGE